MATSQLDKELLVEQERWKDGERERSVGERRGRRRSKSSKGAMMERATTQSGKGIALLWREKTGEDYCYGYVH